MAAVGPGPLTLLVASKQTGGEQPRPVAAERMMSFIENDVVELASIAVTPESDQEMLQRVPAEVDEIITSFGKTYAYMAELQRVPQRTCRRAEDAVALARAIRSLRL